MRIALIGQQAFGQAVLEAFLARGDTVSAVFCAPEKGKPDPLRLAAQAAGIATHQLPRLTSEAALEAIRGARADLGIMAYVTQFVSQAFCDVPEHGTIQFHPSLLPLHRGASAMSWSIIRGRNETGLSIFRPTDGLDEGPVILQRAVPIEADDTLGTVYFGKIFPAGVAALLEAADLVCAGRAVETAQVAADASYEGILGEAESQVHWAMHVDLVYDLIRGCDPAPAAWTTHGGRKLFLFDVRKRVAQTYAEVKGKAMGEVVAVGEGLAIQAQGGAIVAARVRWDGGKKIAAADAGLALGTVLGT